MSISFISVKSEERPKLLPVDGAIVVQEDVPKMEYCFGSEFFSAGQLAWVSLSAGSDLAPNGQIDTTANGFFHPYYSYVNYTQGPDYYYVDPYIGSGGGVGFYIDFTNYTKAVFEVEFFHGSHSSTAAYAAVNNTANLEDGRKNAITSASYTLPYQVRTEVELDLSSVSGSHYLYFGVRGPSCLQIKIYSIKLCY